MKILHVVAYYPPEKVGGVGEFVAGLHGSLERAGHQSDVLTSGTTSSAHVQRAARGKLAWFLGTALWVRRARHYDVVHVQSGEAVPLLLLLRLFRRRPRILSTFHVSSKGIAGSFRTYQVDGRPVSGGLRGFLYGAVIMGLFHHWLDRLTILLSDQVNTISWQSARDVLGEQRAARTPVIYYGLPELELAGEETSRLPSTDVLYVGVGGHRKRVLELAPILEHLDRARRGTNLRIIGFQPESEPDLLAQLRERGLIEQVEFLGVKTSQELAPYYARAKVLVVPSAYEGLPFVVLEAMRAALPVVATRVSGHPEAIVDGENGFLVELDAPQQMADRCLRLLQNEEKRRRMGEAARRTFLERFQLDRQVAEYLSLYQRLVGT